MKYLVSLSFLMISGLMMLQAQEKYYYGVDQPFVSRWALGASIGGARVMGEVDGELQGTYQIGLTLQKSAARSLDLRIQLNYGQARGLNTTATTSFNKNTPWNGRCSYCNPTPTYDTLGSKIYYNFNSQYYDGAFQVKLNLNRLFGKDGGEAWDLYVMGGIGAMLYKTTVNALDGQSTEYLFDDVPEGSESDVRSTLKGMLDNTFETIAEQDYNEKSGIGQHALIPMLTTGAGFRIKLSNHWGVGLEARYNFTGDNLIDGVRWDNNNQQITKGDDYATAALTFDYTFFKE